MLYQKKKEKEHRIHINVLSIREVRETKQKGSVSFLKTRLKPPVFSILGLSKAQDSLLLKGH